LLRDKLNDSERFREGLIFLYNYKCFTEIGCSVKFIKEDNKERIVDLKVTKLDGNYDFFIECSEIKENEQEKNIRHTFRKISTKVTELSSKKNLKYCGSILVEYISNSEIDNILFQVDQTAHKAIIENYAELDNPYLKLAFSKEMGFEKLKEFINKNNLRDNPNYLTHGLLLVNMTRKIGLEPQTIAYVNKENPIIDDNFIGYLRCLTTNIIPISNKIINKIKQKRKQIKQFKSNKNTTNGLFIQSEIFFNKDLDRNSKLLEEYIKNTKSIDILIIYNGHGGGVATNQDLQINENICYINQNLDLVDRQIVIIKNKNSNSKEITNIFYETLKKAMSTNTLLH
jgi:hypothetical protein